MVLCFQNAALGIAASTKKQMSVCLLLLHLLLYRRVVASSALTQYEVNDDDAGTSLESL